MVKPKGNRRFCTITCVVDGVPQVSVGFHDEDSLIFHSVYMALGACWSMYEVTSRKVISGPAERPDVEEIIAKDDCGCYADDIKGDTYIVQYDNNEVIRTLYAALWDEVGK